VFGEEYILPVTSICYINFVYSRQQIFIYYTYSSCSGIVKMAAVCFSKVGESLPDYTVPHPRKYV
jgi:hypothetical protein